MRLGVLPAGQSIDGRQQQIATSRRLPASPSSEMLLSRRALFFQHGITLLDQPVELLLLLSNALRCSFLILCAGEPGSLFSQLPQIVLQYRDAVVEFR
jgi:hypothetical protein